VIFLTDKIPGLQDIFQGIYSSIVEAQNTTKATLF